MNELAAVIRAWSERPFRYGLADCCQFAADAVRLRRPGDPMRRFRYSDEDSARALVSQYGSLRAAITSELGNPVDVSETTEGDVLLVDSPVFGQAAAIRYRDRCIVRTAAGVTDWPLSRAVCGWRV